MGCSNAIQVASGLNVRVISAKKKKQNGFSRGSHRSSFGASTTAIWTWAAAARVHRRPRGITTHFAKASLWERALVGKAASS
jgi:hypothetical protein